jgi:hypothetical protein
MARWFPLESADADLFKTAPHVFTYELHYAASPERVWESLASEESLSAWGSTVSSLTWLSPRPFGVGTIREVGLGPAKVHERFFRWDEGHGYSFYVYEANAPMFRRFAEDYIVEADGDGTKFTWTVAGAGAESGVRPVGRRREALLRQIWVIPRDSLYISWQYPHPPQSFAMTPTH